MHDLGGGTTLEIKDNKNSTSKHPTFWSSTVKTVENA